MPAGTILLILAITVITHILGAGTLRSDFWGTHFYGFFPPAVLLLATALLLASAGLVLFRRTAREGVVAWVRTPSRAARGMIPAGLVLVSSALFWLGRTSHTYLGDGSSLSADIPAGLAFHPRQPLTMALQHRLYEGLAPWLGRGERPDVLVAEDALAVGSVLAGSLFVWVVWLLAGELARLCPGQGDERSPSDGLRGDPRTSDRLRLVLALVLLSQGTVQLFFGYVENYSFYTVCLALYLWLALRVLRRAGTILLPGLALLLGVTLHLSAAILLPSFVALVVWSLAAPTTRRRTGIELAVLGAATVVTQVAMSRAGDGYDLLGTMVSVGAVAITGQQEKDAGYLLSGVHFRDFFNEQLLIGPLGFFLFVPAVATAAWRRLRWDPVIAFLFVAALSVLGASGFAGDSNLGYARNWDLLAPGGLVLTVAGLGFLLWQGSIARSLLPALACAVLISLYHTTPWILTNASFDRSFERLKTLPLGKGRTEMLVGKWYIRQNEPDQAEQWLRKATEVNPNNNNAYYILGLLQLQRGQAEAAADALARAVALRPDKVDIRGKLVEALLALDRPRDALPHLQVLTERAPTVQRWMEYGNALRSSGRTGEAQRAFEQALLLHEEVLRATPDDFEANLQQGIMLANLGEIEDALPYLGKALEADGDSEVALFYTGYTLLLLNQRDEAKVLLRRCLEINPRHPRRADIERWIGPVDGSSP